MCSFSVCVLATVDTAVRAARTLLRMTQDAALDAVVRQRIRGLRRARGWSLDSLARRAGLTPSTLSRIETGDRRIALDQLVPIARALETSLDRLVEAPDDADVVIRPEPQHDPGRTTWVLSRETAVPGMVVVKLRITAEQHVPEELPVHPGREWFTVLSGVARVQLGERVLHVGPGQAAEFSTMVPHAITADDGPVELLAIFTSEGERAHGHN